MPDEVSLRDGRDGKMDTATRIMRVLAICCLCNMASHAEQAKEEGGPEPGNETGVAMEITELDVNDSTLTLSYNITNATDRDAWVCSSIASSEPFEVFLTSDKQTLVIRKRLDVPTTVMWRPPGPVGTYLRIAPGASLADSVRIVVPVTPRFLYARPGTTEVAQTVTRLALEIGYYDADLPGIIRAVIATVEKSGLTVRDIDGGLLDTYFRGFRLRVVLGDFDLLNKDPYGQGRVSIRYSQQALTDEKVLRVDVNDVAIPYAGPIERPVQ
jgi:hypothetical protein